MNPRVYLETTFISYLASKPSRDLITAAHQRITAEWWERRRKHFDLYISQLVIQEASSGDQSAVRKRLDLLKGLPLLAVHGEAERLAAALIKKHALPEKAVGDALHIAIATVHGMDYLLSWNCKHIANAELWNRVAEACRASGYEPPVMCTPEELSGD